MRLLDFHTVANSSDHDALIVTYRVGGRLLRVGTWNAGNASDAAVRFDLVKLLGQVDILCLNEVGDRDLEVLLPGGWCHRMHSRVALVWRADFPPLDAEDDVLLSARQWAGKGAGPDNVQRKHLVGAVWQVGKRRVRIGAIHLVASQWNPLRKLLAYRELRVVAQWASRSHAVIIAGDTNAKPTSSIFRLLKRVGLRRVPSGATHGNRAIDHHWYRG